MKTSLTTITNNQNTSAINDNFAKIQDALNNGVLWRENPVGEANQMGNLLDMNGGSIVNGGDAHFTTVVVNGTDISQQVQNAKTSADQAAVSAASALDSSQKVQTQLNSILPQNLLAWGYSQSFAAVSATRDVNGAIISASIVWPDGASGVFTTDVASTAFPGAIDAWHATYINGAVVKTVTQSTVVRDANGAVINQPVINVS